MAFGATLMFIVMTIVVLRSGKKVTVANPWGPHADTLEWTVPCPAPHHTFEELPKFNPTAAH
jgi:cytochrome c oxidase subunit 1